jgi:16S rRNA (adenine1518-N6/adenine1519-N6)-dimethyltransferase
VRGVAGEAVERLLSPPGCKSYTALGVVFALYARVEVLFELPPEAFSPAPKVTSTCMRIAFAPPAVCAEPAPGEGGGDGVQASARRPINLHSDVRAIHGLARAAFMERRKMLRQALKPFLAGLAQPAPDADGAAPAPRELPERFATLRAEQLAPADFVELADALGLLSSTTAPAAT